jgi:hypothetical protein
MRSLSEEQPRDTGDSDKFMVLEDDNVVLSSSTPLYGLTVAVQFQTKLDQ